MHIKTVPSHWTASRSCIKVGGVSQHGISQRSGALWCHKDFLCKSPPCVWLTSAQTEREVSKANTGSVSRQKKTHAASGRRRQRLPEKASCKCGGRAAWAPDMRPFNTSEERRDTHRHAWDAMDGEMKPMEEIRFMRTKSRRWATKTPAATENY